MRNQNYYYFAATLSPINYGDKPPISSEDFRKLCRENLSKEDAELLKYCYFDSKLAVETTKPTGSEFIDSVLTRIRVLIVNIAALRAKRLGRKISETDFIDETQPAIDAGKTAYEMDDPLEATLYLNKESWIFLDELMKDSYFDVDNIYCYLLRLQLLERLQIFDVLKGNTEYKQLYDTILNDYNTNFNEA